MGKTTTLTCAYCGKQFEKDNAEIKRQLKKGRTNFFCSLSCGAKYSNTNKIKPLVEKICPVCGKHFIVSTKQKCNKTFCSRSCASKGSVTEYRRQKAKEVGKQLSELYPSNAQRISILLKNREFYKYELLYEYLVEQNESFEFEFVIENKIFDLALLNKKTLIEFDEKWHKSKECIKNDEYKDSLAKKYNWKLIRIPVETSGIILVETFLKALENTSTIPV